MIKWLIPQFIGNKNEREINRIRPTVARINEIEEALQREPFDRLLQFTSSWQSHLARYHALEAPQKQLIERMDDAGLRTTAEALDARLSVLRGEFPSLPPSVVATVASIESAKTAFHQIEAHFGKSRTKYLEKILPEAYAVVKNGARRLCGSTFCRRGGAPRF